MSDALWMLLVVVHLTVAAAWMGSMAYSLIQVQPTVDTFFPDEQRREEFLVLLGHGNRWKVVGLVAVVIGTGFAVALTSTGWGNDRLPLCAGLLCDCGWPVLVRVLATLAGPGLRSPPGAGLFPAPVACRRDGDAPAHRYGLRDGVECQRCGEVADVSHDVR